MFLCSRARLALGVCLVVSLARSGLGLTTRTNTCDAGVANCENQYHIRHAPTERPTLTVGGDLILNDAAQLFMYSGPTNGVASSTGALLAVTFFSLVFCRCHRLDSVMFICISVFLMD